MRVLIVDDNEDILDAFSLILKELGYYVSTAISQSQTFKEISQNTPDVILLDILLSGSDGREICKYLKSQNSTRHIPIIMVSAYPNVERDSKKSGADDFLAKPFDINLLLEKIEHFTKPNYFSL